jgi:hypothetical protein
MSEVTLLAIAFSWFGALVGLLIAWATDACRRPRCTRCTEDCPRCQWPTVDDDTHWN